jgi:site-specific DNA-methyltransferase (adenine-specific)
VALRGGVCSFLWAKSYEGECDYYSHINNTIDRKKRPLKTFDNDILIRFNGGLSVLEKVQAKCESYIKEEAYSRNAFDLPSDLKASKSRQKGYLKVYLPKGKKLYIKPSKIPNYSKSEDLIGSWKVIVAKASPGEDTLPHSVISTPIISEPGSLCTDSHLLVRVVIMK